DVINVFVSLLDVDLVVDAGRDTRRLLLYLPLESNPHLHFPKILSNLYRETARQLVKYSQILVIEIHK
ncbi:hypothetical protein, partial [uncultured Muribaculum sp.]